MFSQSFAKPVRVSIQIPVAAVFESVQFVAGILHFQSVIVQGFIQGCCIFIAIGKFRLVDGEVHPVFIVDVHLHFGVILSSLCSYENHPISSAGSPKSGSWSVFEYGHRFYFYRVETFDRTWKTVYHNQGIIAAA